MKNFRPLILFVGLLLIVGMACSAVSGGGDAPQPQQNEQPQSDPVEETTPPTKEPVPTPTESEPEPTQPPVVSKFFTEEFDTTLSSDWSIFTVTGSADADADKVTVDVENGKLAWNFDSEYVYYYIFYNAHTYEDVMLKVQADNRGKNNNSVSLICRYDPNVGWYEFNIANNGLYDILYGEVTSDGDIKYNAIANGGSNDIKQGKDVNEYSISCDGDKLSLTINGKEVKSITEKNYALREGQVGISVSSFNVLPIQVEMDWIEISEP